MRCEAGEPAMKGATLFSGIGAPERAMPWVDWRWCAEIDPFASAVHAARFPDIVNHGDVAEIRADAVEPVDLIVFGSPCQSFSVAGRRLGLDDPRGNLALIALRLLGQLRPRWFVFENVPGLLSSDGGRDFGTLLGTMGELGYGLAYRVLDAQYFGVPQRRRRVFVVGHLGDWRPAAAVLFERESLRGHPPPRREAGERTASTLAARTRGGGGLGTDFDGGLIADGPIPYDFFNITAPVNRQNRKPGDPCHTLARDNAAQATIVTSTGDVAHCLNAGGMGRQDYETETMVAHSLRGEGFDASEDGTGRGTPLAVAYNSQVEIRHGDAEKTRSVTVLRALRGALGEEAAQQWKAGVDLSFQASEVLRHDLHGGSVRRQADEAGCGLDDGALSRAEGMPAWPLSEVWQAGRSGRAPRGRGLPEQLARELDAALSELSSQGAQGREALHDLWRQAQSLGPLQSPLHPAQGRPHLAVRRLTPREAERLQGFPDDWTLVTYRGKPAADGPRYKAIGNSMAVPVVEWIGSRLLAAHLLFEPRHDRQEETSQ